MQKRLLKIGVDGITTSINALEALKTTDLKSRKSAKVSQKSKWTKRIFATTKTLAGLRACRAVVKTIPKRV